MIRTDEFGDVTSSTAGIDDWAGPEATSDAVVAAVASAARVDPIDLEPLDDVIDADALNALFEPRSNGVVRTGVSVHFRYHGYDVSIDGPGSIRVERA